MDEFCRNDLIRFQTPFQASRLNRQMINDNLIHYSDDHIGLFPTHMLRGYYNREHQNLSRDGIHSRRETSDDPPPPPLSQMGSLDVAIIEASGNT